MGVTQTPSSATTARACRIAREKNLKRTLAFTVLRAETLEAAGLEEHAQTNSRGVAREQVWKNDSVTLTPRVLSRPPDFSQRLKVDSVFFGSRQFPEVRRA
jgi:hypothetical protein